MPAGTRADGIMTQRFFITLAFVAAACSAVVAQTTAVSREDSLPEVVVTGTGTQHLLKDAPVQTEVISGKLLRSYAGSSLEDILAGLTASFAFNEDDMGSQMQLNGLGNNYILVLIDGKRIHGDVGGENDLSLIDPQNIERIEIVKGASSALYGSDAIAGVINIITRKHSEGLLIENASRVGSYGDLRQHNSLAVRWGNWSSLTNFQLQHSDGWQNTATEDPSQTEFLITDSRNKTVNRHTNWKIDEQIDWQPTKQLSLYAAGSIYWKRIYRPCGNYASTDVYTYDLHYRNAAASIGGKWQLEGGDFVSLDIDWNRHAYYYAFTATTLVDQYVDGELNNYFPYFAGQKQLQSDQQRTMAALKSVFSLPFQNRLSAGAEWRYDWLKAPTRVEGGKASDNTAALYAQDELDLLHPLNITAGLRLNHNEQFGWKLTPKLSAMLSVGEDLRLRATWSQGFKTPTPKELHYRYVRSMNGTYLYLGNTDLQPQTSNYYSLGAEWTIGPLTLTLTGYHNNVQDMITLVTISNSQAPAELLLQYDPIKTRQYQNVESAKTWGIDFSARLALGDWAAGLNYSYLDTDAETYDTDHDRLTKVIIDGTAHHKGNLYVTWNHALSRNYRLALGIYGRMSSKRYYQINGNGKGYQIWRLSTTHDIGPAGKKMSYRLEAGVDNIFNYVDRTYHGLHLGTTTPGTTLFAKFTVKFAQGKNLKKTHSHQSTSNNAHSNEED